MVERTHGFAVVGDGGSDRQQDTSETERSGGEPPPTATTTTVVPFDDHEVPAGDWIVHALSYEQEVGQEGQTVESVGRDLEQFLDRVDTVARIDGEPVPDPDQYWTGPEQVDEGRWGVEWRYVTPPKPVGTEHTFELSWAFDPPFEPFDGNESFPRIESPGCTYRIVEEE